MYLEIDFTKTFERFRSFCEIYNNLLRINKPQQYKKLSIKSTHVETAKEIARFYGAYLHKNKKYKLDETRRFWITNTGVAKNKLQHRCTIYRHILVLEQCGIITNKIFHGSDCGIEVELNPKLLIFKNDLEQSSRWIQQELFKSSQKSDTVATCKDNDSCHFLETFNLNQQSGNVDSLQHQQETFGKKQGSKVEKGNFQEHIGISWKQQETHAPVAGDVPEFSEWITQYTQQAWAFAKSILYPEQNFTDEQNKLTQRYIREYFSLIKKEYFVSQSQKLFLQFCERVLLAKKYIDRNPSRFIPVPWTWFDKHFANGFRGTLAWLKTVQEKRESLKRKFQNLTELCNLYAVYLTEKSISCYKQIEKTLLEKRDPTLVNLYYHCVADRNNYQGGFLHQYYKE
ncbi:MAG: hypothetical protein MUF12_01800 [Sediminibacterium sp.]|nr:hypothetical protein [Sediminibacterium sp.]